MTTKSTSAKADLRTTQKRYLERIALVRRPNTVINSRTTTNGFIAYLECEQSDVSSFSQLRRDHVEGWLRHLAHRPLKRSTKRNAIIKVRVFLETIQEEGWQEAPRELLFRRGDLPPEDRYLPRPLAPAVDHALREELRRRDGLIPKALLLLRATGLRAQELLDLQTDALRQLAPQQWSLHVPLGKLHSERVIPIDGEAAALFAEIRELRGWSSLPAGPRFLLRHPDGRRYTREALRRALEAAEKRAQLPEHPTPHRLRHTYATELLRSGLRLPVLMKLLGHRTIGMTLRYAGLTGVDVRRAYEEALRITKERYHLDDVRPKRSRDDTTSPDGTRPSMFQRLQDVQTQLEGLRRDRAPGGQKDKIRRLLERLCRLTTDIEAAIS